MQSREGLAVRGAPHSVFRRFPFGLARTKSRNEKPWNDLLFVVGV